jgi:hypothetical protein
MAEQISTMSFIHWVRLKRYYLLLSVGAIVLQFLVFKWIYPYPNFLPDSYSYLDTAMQGRNINKWPIGYSWFLELFGLISRSHWWLVCCQYALLEVAILYFVFSMGYLLQVTKWLFGCMLLIGVVSPLVLHVSNFVSSDALFAALSLIWFTQLIRIACKLGRIVLLLHAVVLLMVFTVRYNAMYYPFISIAVILFAEIRARWKWGSIALMLLFPAAFIGYTQVQYYKETGSVHFSPFSGWQLASNALYAYAHVPATGRSKERFTYVDLQRLADRHMDSLHRTSYNPPLSQGIYYLWDPQSPLQQFPEVWWGRDSTVTGFKRWAMTGPIYKEYGYYLVKIYPHAFLRYYVWPNLSSYYVPPLEFLGSYNMGLDTMEQAGVAWFGLKTNKVHSKTSDHVIHINTYYPLELALVNLFFVLGFIGFVLSGGFAESTAIVKRIGVCFLLIWVCNMGFSVLASPVVLRYQVFPMLVTQTFMLWLAAYILQLVMPAVMPTTVDNVEDKSFII